MRTCRIVFEALDIDRDRDKEKGRGRAVESSSVCVKQASSHHHTRGPSGRGTAPLHNRSTHHVILLAIIFPINKRGNKK